MGMRRKSRNPVTKAIHKGRRSAADNLHMKKHLKLSKGAPKTDDT